MIPADRHAAPPTGTPVPERGVLLQRDLGPDASLEVFLEVDATARLVFEDLFAAALPVEVDLGSGSGGFLVAAAERFPERNFLGVERLLGRVRKTRRKAFALGLRNLRVLREEIEDAVCRLLPEEGVTRFHLSFPDPWPKRRHHRRRVVGDEFLGAVHRALVPGGDLLIQTDHADYFRWIQKHAAETGMIPAEWPADPYPTTDFGERFAAQGLPVYRLRLAKAG